MQEVLDVLKWSETRVFSAFSLLTDIFDMQVAPLDRHSLPAYEKVKFTRSVVGTPSMLDWHENTFDVNKWVGGAYAFRQEAGAVNFLNSSSSSPGESTSSRFKDIQSVCSNSLHNLHMDITCCPQQAHMVGKFLLKSF